MSEVSTRLWFDEQLWGIVTRRAIAEGTTVRELLPRLLEEALAGPVRVTTRQPEAAPEAMPAPPPATPAPERPAHTGPPLMPLSETYTCSICGQELRLGAVSQHMNRHLKEQQATQAEGS